MEYIHERKTYNFEINIMTAIYISFLILSAFFITIGKLRIIMILVFITSFYSVYNNVILRSYIEKVKILGKSIELISGSTSKIFRTEDLKDIKIKQYATDNKLHMTLTDKNNKRSKFIINISKFNNNVELIDDLINLAKEVNPERKIFNTSKRGLNV